MKKIFDFLAKKSDILIRAKPNYQIVYTEKKNYFYFSIPW